MGGIIHELNQLTLIQQEARHYVGMTSLVQDWLYASRHAKPGEEHWVDIVRQGGRGCETCIDRESLERAFALYKQGIKPPPIPSRSKGRSNEKEGMDL
jgi:hypothetical protein